MIDLSAGPLGDRDASRARRVEVARQAVLESVAHYHQMMRYQSETWELATEHLGPHGPVPDYDNTDPERKGWKAIRKAANQRFDSAELALAHCIQNFHAWFVEGADDPDRLPYPNCAVKVNGIIYVLAYDVAHYEPGENFVGVVSADRVIELG